jgi:hypothetical protein
MKAKKKRVREIQEAIGRILLHDWDPIEVRSEPLAQSEYDSYAGGVYRLLASMASEQEIADHLRKIQVEEMGLSFPEVSTLLAVARKLKALDVGLERQGPPF